MKKARKFILLGVAGLLVVVLSALAYVKMALPDVGNAPDLKIAGTQAQVARGKYLAHNVMVCMDCHSERDWTKFSAPIKDGTWGKGGEVFSHKMGLPGVFHVANITPACIGNWTDGEIFRAVTTGVSKGGQALFPIMPHPYYGQVAQEDIEAVIAYLRTLPAIDNKVPASEADFPMNFIINTIPKKANLQPIPSKEDPVLYGKYLVTAAACADCHTMKEKGQNILEMEFAGGMEFPLPSGGHAKSANLTPDKETGLGNWTQEAFVNRFKQYADPSYRPHAVGKGEFNTIMPWTMFAGMEREDLAAIYAYLQSLAPIKHKVTHFSAQ